MHCFQGTKSPLNLLPFLFRAYINNRPTNVPMSHVSDIYVHYRLHTNTCMCILKNASQKHTQITILYVELNEFSGLITEQCVPIL